MNHSKVNNKDDLFGLKKGDLAAIITILQKETDVEEALIYGSRAKGNYKNGSDVDIALKGKTLNHNVINNISFLLNEESLMPYKFDVLNYHAISNNDLVKHIDRVGVVLYQKYSDEK